MQDEKYHNLMTRLKLLSNTHHICFSEISTFMLGTNTSAHQLGQLLPGDVDASGPRRVLSQLPGR